MSCCSPFFFGKSAVPVELVYAFSLLAIRIICDGLMTENILAATNTLILIDIGLFLLQSPNVWRCSPIADRRSQLSIHLNEIHPSAAMTDATAFQHYSITQYHTASLTSLLYSN